MGEDLRHERELWERLRAVEVLIEQQRCLWNEREKRLNERWRAQEQALAVALDGQKNINDKQNEFRGALEDQAARTERDMISRKEYEAKHEGVMDLIVRNSDAVAELRKDVAVGSPQVHSLQTGADQALGKVVARRMMRTDTMAALALLVSIAAAVALIVHG